MKSRRIGVGLVAVGAALAMTLSACGGSSNDSQGAAGKPQQGGVLQASVSAEVKSFDPVDLSTYFLSGGNRAIAIYGTLMKYGKEGSVEPAMAKSFKSDDGIKWTLKFRDGVEFTDGTPYDAEAVKFNLERHMASDSLSLGKPLLSDVKDIKMVDPLTLEISLDNANGSFPALFTQGSNLGFIGSPTAMKKDIKKFGAEPVGAGPYVLTEFVRDGHVTVERNDNYWDKPKPYIDKIVYKVIPDNQTKVQSLISNDVQLADSFSADAWGRVADNDQFKVYKEGSLGAFVLFPNVQRGPSKDLEIRKAMQMAFEPKASSKVLSFGYGKWDGKTNCIPFPQDAPQCTDDAYPKSDLSKAKQIVSDYVAKGNSNEIKILAAQPLAKQAEYAQQVLESAGFKVKLDKSDLATYNTLVAEGNYEAVVTAVLPFANPYPKLFNYFYGSDNYPKQEDEDLNKSLQTAKDADTLAKRQAAWKDALTQIDEKGYATWLAPASSHMASAKNVHMGDEELAGTTLWYPTDIWVDQK